MSASERNLYFDGRLSNLGVVSTLLQEVCKELGLDEVTSYHVELAVVEAVTNGMRHAIPGEGRRPMHVAVSVEGDDLRVSVSDRGRPAKLELPSRHEDRAVPAELEEGGRGLFLICSLMDHVEHRSSRTGNTVLMSKTLPRAAGSA
jgi:serine/threonine-protein kinase RsbW